MPTVSESLAKLSASMAELSQRAKEAEDHIAAARNETHEQLEARVAKAKATAQRRRQETKARGAKAKDSFELKNAPHRWRLTVRLPHQLGAGWPSLA